jgi:hypothetical protein
MKNDIHYEVILLQSAVQELKSLEMRNTIRLLGVILILAGVLIYGMRTMQNRTVPDAVEEDLSRTPKSGLDPSLAALDAASAAMVAAKAARPKIVVKYLPTLDDQFVDIKKRPLLSSYVLGDMFDIASVHPTTPDIGIGEVATFKGLVAKPAATFE